jgi:hypothetical protein
MANEDFTNSQILAIQLVIDQELRRARRWQYSLAAAAGVVGGALGYLIGVHL